MRATSERITRVVAVVGSINVSQSLQRMIRVQLISSELLWKYVRNHLVGYKWWWINMVGHTVRHTVGRIVHYHVDVDKQWW
jgi:hypothetical protein